jgi:hypothetical protein
LHPSGEILVKGFLLFHTLSDDDQGAVRQQPLQEGGKEGLSRWGDVAAGNETSLLQAPCNQLHSGSCFQAREQMACRSGFDCLRQAAQTLAAPLL